MTCLFWQEVAFKAASFFSKYENTQKMLNQVKRWLVQKCFYTTSADFLEIEQRHNRGFNPGIRDPGPIYGPVNPGGW